VHGSNARNLSVRLSLSQTSKKGYVFLIISCFLFNKIGGHWNRFCEVAEEVAQTIYTHMSKCKNDKLKMKKKNGL
jgi:hypothetical protein